LEVIGVAFNVLFLAHAPDGDAEKHRCVIETPDYYKLTVIVVRDQQQAIQVCKEVVKEEGVQSILLCPDFTHRDVAELSVIAGENVGIFVARGDGPSNKISIEAMTRAGWSLEQGRE
jgi:hypothetical protein